MDQASHGSWSLDYCLAKSPTNIAHYYLSLCDWATTNNEFYILQQVQAEESAETFNEFLLIVQKHKKKIKKFMEESYNVKWEEF